MHFCTVCQNMYYTKLGGEDQNQLIYYCRKCGHKNDVLSMDPDNICVSKTHIKHKSTSFKHMVNKYTKLDPTLPRVKNIPCPNSKCSSKMLIESKDDDPESIKKDNEIIYLRYDDSNLKYIYVCTACDTVWKSESN
jgi:DNA-directed RNA polymerase subunit M/transcription elongation factor TFIIS